MLVMAGVLTLLTPEPPTLPPASEAPLTNPNIVLPQLAEVEFVGTPPSIPNSFNIYRAQSQARPEETARQLAARLNIPPSGIENVWADPVREMSVIYRPAQQRIVLLTNAEVVTPTPNNVFSLERTIAAATAYVRQELGLTSLSPLASQVEFHNEEGDENEREAPITSIPSGMTLDNYPVFFELNQQHPVLIYLNRNYEVIKAEFNPQPPTPEPSGNAPAISMTEAMENIKAGRGEVLSATSTTTQIRLEELVKISFNSLKIEYRLSLSAQQYLPYYRLEGVGELSTGEQLNIVVVTPAT
jgi:hypothetical protein